MTVTDQGVPPQSSFADVQVNVLRNENRPRFVSDYINATIAETVTYGTVIVTATATDQDAVQQPEVGGCKICA